MIIGLGHVARVGKDTAAYALVERLRFDRIGFADQLRELALKADPLVYTGVRPTNVDAGRGKLAWVVGGMGWEAAKDSHREVRSFLQNLGVGCRAVFGEDFWVDQLFAKVDRLGVKDVVVPDVRFPNEAQAIKDRGGKLVRIDRPGHYAGGHVSETALDDYDGWDAVLVNDGSVFDLQSQLVDLVVGWMHTPRSARKASGA
jgi:hypothetical protein